ncbi:hypothetical protein PCH_Pc15g02050 [Penicillium rubens Wisconsin 54-1255]|uniref:Uncharacterized protein n=1 Tax=Penicillium rubens (strain ATCC 28089 / DSM 1075 / NRRL 1951 / Wisconsin 54-1255) TaxID=500485 RepID=B6H6D9_PENRW|nr:hypothetical protein PCH_Pc15g02050 [Penicillium rubens Wisconsin 54-1255]
MKNLDSVIIEWVSLFICVCISRLSWRFGDRRGDHEVANCRVEKELLEVTNMVKPYSMDSKDGKDSKDILVVGSYLIIDGICIDLKTRKSLLLPGVRRVGPARGLGYRAERIDPLTLKIQWLYIREVRSGSHGERLNIPHLQVIGSSSSTVISLVLVDRHAVFLEVRPWHDVDFAIDFVGFICTFHVRTTRLGISTDDLRVKIAPNVRLVASGCESDAAMLVGVSLSDSWEDVEGSWVTARPNQVPCRIPHTFP